jgi:rhodanese-related sulfurtransferase
MKTKHNFIKDAFRYRGTVRVLFIRFIFLVLLLVAVANETAVSFCFADGDVSLIASSDNKRSLTVSDLKEIEVSGPYCGIYSLIACFDVYGIKPDIRTLLVPEYVGSFQGSSDKELIKAAEMHGLYGKTYSNLTWKELEKSESPMILHFRSSYADQKFNHWVTYLGTDGGKARIIDVPHELATVPFAELMAKWDGTAITISDKPITEQFFTPASISYLGIIVLLFGGVFFIRQLFWEPSKEASVAPTLALRLKFGVLQTGALLGLVFVVAIFYHAISETGFLRNPSAVAEVTRRYYSVDVPEISLSEMQRIVEDKKLPIFDARYVRDYQYGTIPGAKSLSINSNLNERQQQLQGIGREQRIVVFCQSSGCGYSDEVAQFLKFNNYNNVVIYRGGYAEWEKTRNNTAAKP